MPPENFSSLFSLLIILWFWGQSPLTGCMGELSFWLKIWVFNSTVSPSLLQSVTMFHPSTFPVLSFSPLYLYPNFDVPHLSPGQHHGLSTGLPATTHFNPSFLLLSERFSKTQIDHVILPSSPTPQLSLAPHGQHHQCPPLSMVSKPWLTERF